MSQQPESFPSLSKSNHKCRTNKHINASSLGNKTECQGINIMHKAQAGSGGQVEHMNHEKNPVKKTTYRYNILCDYCDMRVDAI